MKPRLSVINNVIVNNVIIVWQVAAELKAGADGEESKDKVSIESTYEYQLTLQLWDYLFS